MVAKQAVHAVLKSVMNEKILVKHATKVFG